MIPRSFFAHVARVAPVSPASSVNETPPTQQSDPGAILGKGFAHTTGRTGTAGDELSVTSGVESGARGWESSGAMYNEKTPLLHASIPQDAAFVQDSTHISIPKRIAGAIVGTLRVVISTLLAPGRLVVACFYDEHGRFSAVLPVHRVGHLLSRKQRRRKAQAVPQDANNGPPKRPIRSQRPRQPSTTAVPAMSDVGQKDTLDDLPDRRFHSSHIRSLSTSSTGSEESESSRPKRSIRINTLNEETLRNRKHRQEQQKEGREGDAPSNPSQPALTVDSIKSPINPVSSARLLKYPRTPAPPRPLVPRRQPSYVLEKSPISEPQKTLIIDLDETLIHSMAKGGRMSTGHMVEVKLSSPVGAGGVVLGPQVPILYYVHKRPHCDMFLQKVSEPLRRSKCRLRVRNLTLIRKDQQVV